MADKGVEVKISVDSAQGKRGLDELEKGLSNVNGAAGKAAESAADAGRSVEELGDSATTAGTEVESLAQSVDQVGQKGAALGKEVDQTAEAVSELGSTATAAGSNLSAFAQSESEAGQHGERLDAAINEASAAVAALGGAAVAATSDVDSLAKAEGNADQQAAALEATADAASSAVGDLEREAEEAGKSFDGLGDAAGQAGKGLDEVKRSVEAKTSAIKASLQVEQSELEVQRQLLAASRAELQARLDSAQAAGDEASALKARNGLRQVEGDQLALLATAKRAEAAAVREAAEARHVELSAIGPLTKAQSDELRAAENHAQALSVEAAAAHTAALRTRDLSAAHKENAAATVQLDGALSQVTKAITGLFAAGKLLSFAKDTIAVADAYGQMAERIKMASNGTAEYELVQRRLLESANLTYRPLAEQQELYIQTAAALRSMKYSTEEVLDITDSFSYLLTTNATTSERAKNAIDAYTKSIQSGRVETDSWQSIMAATPTIVDSIATATGKTAEEVRRLGITGQLSIADLNEGLRQTVELNKQAASGMSATVRDALTRLSNTWSVYVGEANEANAATAKIAKMLDTVSANLGTIVSAATLAGEVMVAVWGVRALQALVTYIASLRTATLATQALTLETLKAASAAEKLGMAGKLAIAGWVGWEIGTYLKNEFETVERAGIALAAGLTKTAAVAKTAWEIVKAGFTDETIAAAQERLTKKLREIDDEFAELFASVGKVGDAQTKLGQKTDAAAGAAGNASVQWSRLTDTYKLVYEEVTKQVELADKELSAVKARGQSAQELAKLFGDEVAQRKAAGDAARAEAAALNELANKRQMELDIMKAELASKQAVLKASNDNSVQRQKEIADLERAIRIKQLDVDSTDAQVKVANAHAHAMREEAQAAAAATSAAQAKSTARIAEAKASVSLLETEKSLLEQAQRLAELAGNEVVAREIRIKLLEIEIKLTRAKADVQREEAQGSITVAQASLAEMKVKGEVNTVREAELNASIKLAQAKLKEADAIRESTRVTEKIIENVRIYGDETNKSVASTLNHARAHGEVIDTLEREIEAQEKLNELKERELVLHQKKWQIDKERFSLTETGERVQGLQETSSSIYKKAKSAGLDDETALRLSRELMADRGAGWTGNPDMVNKAIDDEVLQQAQRRTSNAGSGATDTASVRSAPTSGAGGSYISNITIDGSTKPPIRYADAESQSNGDALMRELAQARGAAVR